MIDAYLDELAAGLHVSHAARARIIEEVHDHLTDAVADLESRGLARGVAVEQAIAAFGRAGDIARQLDAQTATTTARRIPVLVAATGLTVVVAFLIAAVTQPRPAVRGTAAPLTRISFFLAVLGLQIAVVAGARAASLAAAHWRSTNAPATERALISRAAVVAAGGLTLAAVGWTAALAKVVIGRPHTRMVAGVGGGVLMTLAALVTLVVVASAHRRELRVESTAAGGDDDTDAAARAGALGAGESTVRLVQHRPVVVCAVVAIVAALGSMAHAEATFAGAIAWGGVEALEVVTAFVVLGPTLGLRTTAK